MSSTHEGAVASTHRRIRKAPAAFRTITEVAEELQIPGHVLRYWETRFNEVKPMKRGGGRRYYRPDDIALLRRIADLLYTQGYTIKGAQRVLRENPEGLPQLSGPQYKSAGCHTPPTRSNVTESVAGYRTISAVSNELHIPQHVLRYWETRFEQIKPTKRNGGRRYYRPDDIALLRRIRDLLYTQGLTIEGAQTKLASASDEATSSQ